VLFLFASAWLWSIQLRGGNPALVIVDLVAGTEVGGP
jgi:hypothetical protein